MTSVVRRGFGGALMALGLWVLTTLFWAGEWVLALLAFPVMGAGVMRLVDAFTSARPLSQSWADYAQGLALLAAGLFLLGAPALTIVALKRMLSVYLVVTAGLSLWEAWRDRGTRAAGLDVLAALGALALAALVAVIDNSRPVLLAGLMAAFALITTGWRLSFAPADADAGAHGPPVDRHPDAALGLPADPAFARLHDRFVRSNPLRSRETLRWMGAFVVTLWAIHAVRMGASLSIEGMVPSLVATAGDLLIAVAIFWLLMAPVRLAWRRLSRGPERALWRARLGADDGRGALAGPARRLADLWLDGRFAFAANLKRARGSIVDGLSLAIGQGVVVAALLVAINSIWGFSWYFNTENWASGVYQAVTGPRVDEWREAMARAVLKDEGGEARTLFALAPPGVEGGADFSFLVIGDPGEGDASQAALKDRYLALSRRDEVKFVVISSDVIYPAGEMKDYERNFYMPFKGVTKPIYAIPGNHDWFNALGGFAANLMTPRAARASIDARVGADHGLTLMDAGKREAMIAEAQRLRAAYGLTTGLQRAPYFDIQTDQFALIAIDTGVLKSIDAAQRQWLEAALERARGKFVMAITGHPRYAGGLDTATGDSDFARLYALLEAGGVCVAMAGDTHDFEYYVQEGAAGGRTIQHFLNGGGGAYLSIGTALDWPKDPPTKDWAYYPSTQAVRAKLARETPLWKKPALWWINRFNAWPVSVETLSGVFDFNKAPFFQSFMEVQVRPSRNEIRFLPHGVDGPLRWRDLDASALPSGASPQDDVVFAQPLRR